MTKAWTSVLRPNEMYTAKPAVYIGGCGLIWTLKSPETGVFIGLARINHEFIQVQNKHETWQPTLTILGRAAHGAHPPNGGGACRFLASTARRRTTRHRRRGAGRSPPAVQRSVRPASSTSPWRLRSRLGPFGPHRRKGCDLRRTGQQWLHVFQVRGVAARFQEVVGRFNARILLECAD